MVSFLGEGHYRHCLGRHGVTLFYEGMQVSGQGAKRSWCKAVCSLSHCRLMGMPLDCIRARI